MREQKKRKTDFWNNFTEGCKFDHNGYFLRYFVKFEKYF